jgi:hypothetical protein
MTTENHQDANVSEADVKENKEPAAGDSDQGSTVRVCGDAGVICGGIMQLAATVKSEPTVLSTELMIKHPLQYRWTLWYCKHDRTQKKDWEDCLKQVASFDTVEDFWA